MDTLRIGDRVSWQIRTPARPYLHTITGVVEAFDIDARAFVRDGNAVYCLSIHRLTKLVGPIEAHVTDWEFATGLAGDLGGAEPS